MSFAAIRLVARALSRLFGVCAACAGANLGAFVDGVAAHRLDLALELDHPESKQMRVRHRYGVLTCRRGGGSRFGVA